MIGVNPDEWTLRELVAAKDARIEQEWLRTAALQALVANVNKPKHVRAYDVYDFHPYLNRPERIPTAEELQLIFGGKGGRRAGNTGRQGCD